MKYWSVNYLLFISISIQILLNSSASFAEKRKIGVVLPLTGPASSNGQSIANSIKLASEKFDPANNLQFVLEDDQMQPSKTVAAVNKLIHQTGVSGLIVFGSPTSLAVNDLAEKAKIPMIAMSVVERVVADKQFVVKHWVTAESENAILQKQVINSGYKTVALISTINDAMLRLRDLFVAKSASKIVSDEEVAPDLTDFKSLATKIISRKPAAVYVLLWAPQPGVFTKELRNLGYDGDIFGAHNIEDPHEVSASQGALTGAWYVTGDDRHGALYYQKYLERFGSLPSNGGINGYDCALLMIRGLESGDLNSYLHKVKNFQGAYGNYSATGFNDFSIPATIKKITSHGFEYLMNSRD